MEKIKKILILWLVFFQLNIASEEVKNVPKTEKKYNIEYTIKKDNTFKIDLIKQKSEDSTEIKKELLVTKKQLDIVLIVSLMINLIFFIKKFTQRKYWDNFKKNIQKIIVSLFLVSGIIANKGKISYEIILLLILSFIVYNLDKILKYIKNIKKVQSPYISYEVASPEEEAKKILREEVFSQIDDEETKTEESVEDKLETKTEESVEDKLETKTEESVEDKLETKTEELVEDKLETKIDESIKNKIKVNERVDKQLKELLKLYLINLYDKEKENKLDIKNYKYNIKNSEEMLNKYKSELIKNYFININPNKRNQKEESELNSKLEWEIVMKFTELEKILRKAYIREGKECLKDTPINMYKYFSEKYIEMRKYEKFFGEIIKYRNNIVHGKEIEKDQESLKEVLVALDYIIDIVKNKVIK